MGLAFSVGVAMENSNIISTLPGESWLQFLDNGLTAGTVAAVLMIWFVELTSPRAQRKEAALDHASLAEIDQFLDEIADNNGWDQPSAQRLKAVGEETLWSLIPADNGSPPRKSRGLTVIARPDGTAVELEFSPTWPTAISRTLSLIWMRRNPTRMTSHSACCAITPGPCATRNTMV